MKELIIDVESTCWDNKEEQKNQINEVIEIGYAIVENNKIIENGDIYVKPQYSTISKFCTQLTGITQEKVEKEGVLPKEAYARLNKLFSKVSKWGSYGNYDKNILTTNSQLYKLKLNMPEHFNIRLLASKKYYNGSDPYAAPSNPKDVLQKLKMPWEGRNHNGKDDALNIAKLYLKINSEELVKESYFPY